MKKTVSEKVYVFDGFSKHDDVFNNLSAIVRAASKDETRWFMTGVNVTTDRIIATDGRRLHFMDNKELIDPGYYNIELCTARKIILSLNTDKVDIPNYDRVIPDKKNMIGITIEKGRKGDMLFINDVINKTGCYFNITYLENLPSGEYTMFYHENDFTKSVMFVGRITAVIMPMVR